MERYLLFDAHCITCSAIAQSIETSTNRWVTVRSLHDPDMQKLLTQARSSWKLEPTLLEIEGDHVQIYTGLSLRFRFLLGLGPQKTWYTIRVLQKTIASKNGIGTSRRQLFGRGGAVLGGLLLGLGSEKLFSEGAVQAATQNHPRPINTVHLAPDVAQKQLTASSMFQEATQRLGQPDWEQIYTYHYLDNNEQGLLVPYPATEEHSLTFLAMSTPKEGERDIALIVNVTAKAKNHIEYTWHTHKGELIATQVFQNGKAEVVATTQPDISVTDFDTQCFIGCLGNSVDADCAISCILCLATSLGDCITCAICAGPKGVSCAKQCNY